MYRSESSLLPGLLLNISVASLVKAQTGASGGEPAEDGGPQSAGRASHGARTQRAPVPTPGPAAIRKAKKSQELPLRDPLTPFQDLRREAENT